MIPEQQKNTYYDEGYLSDRARDYVRHFNHEFREEKELYEELNRYTCGLRKRASPPKGPLKTFVFAICLWNRILDCYQCVLILLERGAGDEAKGVLRGMLESLFLLEAALNKKSFIRRYALSEPSRLLDLYSKGLEASRVAKRLGKRQFIPKLRRAEMRAKIALWEREQKKRRAKQAKRNAMWEKREAERRKLQRRIQAKGPSKQEKKRKWQNSYEPSKNAKAAGSEMIFEYNKAYSYLCLYTHPTISGNLEKYLIVGPTGKQYNFVTGPSDKESGTTLMAGMTYLLIALKSLNKFLVLGESAILAKYSETLDNLAPPVE